MSVIEGLAAYQARKAEEEARREAAAKPKVNRFNLVKDGDSAVVRFAQEIDPDATNYNADRGIGFVNIEHNHPDPNNGWKNRANCSTESQGACLPCEKVANYDVPWNDRKGWKQKEKFYINLIAGEAVEVDNPNAKGSNKKAWLTTDIDRKTGDGTVYLLEQGTYNGIWDALAAYAVDEDSNGTITDNFFKITRKGNNFNDTSYVLTPLKEIPKAAKSLDDFELINVKEDILNEVPYAQQDAFYHRNVSVVEEAPVEATVGAGTSAGDADTW
jgi:hypothetical protein